MRRAQTLALALLAGVTGAMPAHADQNTASGNYRIDAVMTAGGAPIRDGADVFVLDAEGDVVARRHAVPAIVDLAPGDYTAAVVYKNAQARGALALGTTPGTNSLNLEAGEVRLDLVPPDGASGGVSAASWTVYRYRPGDAHGDTVAESSAARPELTLDAGWYEVHARYTRSSADAPTGTVVHVIEVKPGRRQTYSIAAGG